jgi:hypothetical protein
MMQITQNAETEDLFTEIEKWNQIIESDERLVEVAFFKIFVKFENFLIEMFTKFSTGTQSSEGYIPNRKLEFQSYEHLKNTVTDKGFIDFNNRIEGLSQQIFNDDNPFTFFFASSDMEFYSKMKYLRNFVAHESYESRNSYKSKTLCSQDFIEPTTFLLKRYKRGTTETNYTHFINIVKTYSNQIIGAN